MNRTRSGSEPGPNSIETGSVSMKAWTSAQKRANTYKVDTDLCKMSGGNYRLVRWSVQWVEGTSFSDFSDNVATFIARMIPRKKYEKYIPNMSPKIMVTHHLKFSLGGGVHLVTEG